MIKLMIFDHDMTLVDSSDAIMASFNLVADAVGRPKVNHEQVMHCIALPLPQFCEGLLGEYRPEWVDIYLKVSPETERKLLRPFPDTVPTVTRLREMGVSLAVASNREDPRPAMEGCGIARYFDALLGAVGPKGRRPYKPDPAMLLELMDQFSALPEQTLYIGDSDIDIETALAAKVRGVGVARGHFTAEQLLSFGAWRVVASLEELPSIAEAEGVFPQAASPRVGGDQ